MRRVYIARIPTWRLNLDKYIDVELNKRVLVVVCATLWSFGFFVIGFTWATLTYYK